MTDCSSLEMPYFKVPVMSHEPSWCCGGKDQGISLKMFTRIWSFDRKVGSISGVFINIIILHINICKIV